MGISDLGLYGPESVTWRLHADPTMGPAGLRALFLQALHPRAITGVLAHSDFRADPWGRLFRTADYVGVTTYGTAEQAGRAGARVRGIHRRLSAVDPDTGETYRLDEPDLLRWVHCCEVDSFLDTARRAGMTLTDEEADRYVAEQVRNARLVGLDPRVTSIPETVEQLADYFLGMRSLVRATPEAREAIRFILVPPMPYWVRFGTPAQPGWAGMATLGFCLLPRWARRLYALPGLPTTDLGATLAVRALRTALMAVPAAVRNGPHQRAGEARVAAIPVRRLDVVG